ncbi:MAG: hypothetical protein E7141_06910 [Rikenellaceae bacterium]|nr:hypothetical protein [Rikenellaceae bacterium]
MKRIILTLVISLGLIVCMTSCEYSSITNPRQDAIKMLNKLKHVSGVEEYRAWENEYNKIADEYEKKRSLQEANKFRRFVLENQSDAMLSRDVIEFR